MCIVLFIARYFIIFTGIAYAGLYSAYAGEKKKLVAESMVFDLKSSSSLTVYGNVSDKGSHPVANVTVTLRSSRDLTKETTTENSGNYSITGLSDGESYSVFAQKSGLGQSKKIKFKTKKGDDRDVVVCLKFKRTEVPGGGKPTPTPTTTPSSGGKPEDLVHIPLYSSSNPFAQKIESDPEIDPNSDTMVKGLVTEAARSFVVSINQYTPPVYYADENTPRYEVTLKCGKGWELGVTKLKNVPIPDWAEPSNDTHEGEIYPEGCGGSDNGTDEGDFLMTVVDTVNRCEYDFWQAKEKNGKWTVSWANSISIDSDGIFEKGLSCRGSGFALMNGLIWPDELKAGKINHAIAFSYDLTRAGGPVFPATDSDGTSKGSEAIPEGARVQLDPTLDLDSLGLNDYEKTIAKALQDYGMILVDDGGGIQLYAVHAISTKKNPYEGIFPNPEKDYISLENIPADKFRVLKLPAQDTDWRDKLSLVENDCADFE